MEQTRGLARNERDEGTTYATTANNANEFATRILSARSSPWNEPIAKEWYENERHVVVSLRERDKKRNRERKITLHIIHFKFYDSYISNSMIVNSIVLNNIYSTLFKK